MNNEWLLEPKTAERFNVTRVSLLDIDEEVVLVKINDEYYSVSEEVANVVDEHYCSVVQKIDDALIREELSKSEAILRKIGLAYLKDEEITIQNLYDLFIESLVDKEHIITNGGEYILFLK